MESRKHRPPFLLGENLGMALATLRDHAYRSLLTILGVFIGVLIIIGVAAVLNGFRQRVVDQVESFGTNNIYVTRMPPVQLGRPSSELRRRRDLLIEDGWAIRDQCPAVEAVSIAPEDMPRADFKYRGREATGCLVRGVFPAAMRVLGLELEQGRFFTEEETRRRLPLAVIGHDLAQTLFPGLNPLDRELEHQGMIFRVIGVFQPSKGSPFGGASPDDTIFIIPYWTFKRLYPWAEEIMIAARAYRGQLAQALEQIEEVLRRRRNIGWFAANDFELSTADSFIETFDRIVFATMAVMFALSTVAFMVGGVGVMNIMLASVKERTREIGLRRALGARRRDITWQFLIEAMVLTGLGGLLGIAAGELLMRGLAELIPAMPIAVPLWARLFGFFGSIVVGLLFGLWPALSAARLDPIQALRYE